MDFSVSVEGLDKLAAKSRIVAEIARKEVLGALEVSAEKVRGDAINSMKEGGKSGRIYTHYLARVNGRVVPVKKRNKPHQASAPGEAPAVDGGDLSARGITVRLAKNELLATVSARVMSKGRNYAALLEFGTPTIAPRPFLYPALNANKDWINNRMEQALNRTIDKAARKGVESLR